MTKKISYKIRKFAYCILLAFVSLTFTACKKYNGYTGDYPELYSVAISSLLGTRGYLQSEIRHPSVVEPIEEDAYGRKLFCYFEGRAFDAVSILVYQKSTDGFAYFYPDINFISAPLVKGNKIGIWDSHTPSKIDNPLNDFSTEQIQELKDKNDWGKELDESKCVKSEITRKKKEGPLKYFQMKELCEKIITDTGNSGNQRDVQFFIEDDYGRSMYILYGAYEENIINRYVAVLLFNPDGSYNEETCIMELIDKFNYQDDLKAFKELNNWNQPI